MIKIYTYKNCSTCKNATKWLTSQGLSFDEIAIRETPPTKRELETMLNVYGGDIRKLFNTSGMDYRSLGLKDKLPSLEKREAIQLLTENGNLVKRPFLLSETFKMVGFREADWENGLA
ncbi:MAG: arsenate reductase family protein [Verrucomicrobia bacterium]|nr:arsenate reductase family protein [Verrucomicrobiota bacterium]MDA1065961.1 arsenate reductase family protein [Verrucomicrobiota bacterium]